MGKELQKNMRRALLILAAAALCISAAFSLFVYHLAELSFELERGTVYSMVGSLINEYPEAVSAIGNAVGDNDTHSEIGKDALSKYGYDDDHSAEDFIRYRKIITVGCICSAAAGILLFSGVAAYLYYLNRRRIGLNSAIVDILDKCVSGNYDFLDNGELDTLADDAVAEQLQKIGRSMKIKTEALDNEHDNTKSLVTDISHQLKTPISALKSCFSVYSVSDSAEERNEFIDRCDTQINKLETLAGSLINVSRLETGMMDLHTDNAGITEILINAVNSVYYAALKKDIMINTEEFSDITVLADKKWTSEAIANILDNAVKYSPANSEIKIRVEKLFSFVRIEIQDEGIGIPREERNKVFGRFYRGSSEIIKKEEGSGIGLYLARRIIEHTGGTVSLRPAPHKGTIFTVQLLICK